MSMQQMIGVWGSVPKTDTAGLSVDSLAGASRSYASMDKQINQTSTTTQGQSSNIFGDLLPLVGGAIGSAFGPMGAQIGSTLGGIGGHLMGGTSAAAIGGMGVGLAGDMGSALDVASPWSWSSANKATNPVLKNMPKFGSNK